MGALSEGHLPHACSTYSLGFTFTFAGSVPPIGRSLVLPLSQARGKSPHIHTEVFSFSLPMHVSAAHFAFRCTWMRKSLKSEKDVRCVKMSYSSLVIISKCHKRRNVPRRVLRNSNSGNCVLSKDSLSFQQPIHLLKKYLSGAIISSTVLTSARH